MRKPLPSITEIKAIPILRVAEALGVALMPTGANLYQQKDDDGGVTSLTIFVKTNSFVRFSGKESGGCSKGSVIDFVRHVRNDPDFKNALQFLSSLL